MSLLHPLPTAEVPRRVRHHGRVLRGRVALAAEILSLCGLLISISPASAAPEITGRGRESFIYDPRSQRAIRAQLGADHGALAGAARRDTNRLPTRERLRHLFRTLLRRPTTADDKQLHRQLPLGATYLGEGKTAFVVWAPRAEKLSVDVSPGPGGSSKRHQLEPAADGYFQGVIDGVRPKALYKYVIEPKPEHREMLSGREQAFPDPASRSQPEGVHGRSEVVDRELLRSRRTEPFEPPKLDDMLIYQFHVGTFTPEGTLDAAAAELERPAKLGFNAAQPLPINQFPGERNWGYDPAQIYAVERSYGGPEGFSRWVDSVHDKGMAALVDVVYNHPGPEGNYLYAFGPYFEGEPTPWGRGITAEGKQAREVRRYFIENALHWIADYGVDGLRVDASHALPRPFLRELKQAVDQVSRELGRDVVVIAEDNQNDRNIVLDGGRGRGADSQWSTDTFHAWRVLHTGDRGGYLEDFAKDPLRKFAIGARRGWIYEGQVAPHTGEPRGTKAGDLSGRTHVLPMGDHDQYGNYPTGERFGSRVSPRVRRMTDVTRYLLPVVPQVFSGDEWGSDSPFLYFVDHRDPGVLEATRKGRAEEFAEFFERTGLEPPDPGAVETFERSKLDRGASGKPEHRQTERLHAAMIALRKSHPALRSMDKRSTQVQLFSEQKVVAVHRWARDREVLALLNTSDRPATVDPRRGEIIPLEKGHSERRRRLDGRWTRVIGSEETRFGGSGEQLGTIDLDGDARVTLQPHSAVVLDKRGQR